jgi:hypothetical protein
MSDQNVSAASIFRAFIKRRLFLLCAELTCQKCDWAACRLKINLVYFYPFHAELQVNPSAQRQPAGIFNWEF